jgi:hypothetical protein
MPTDRHRTSDARCGRQLGAPRFPLICLVNVCLVGGAAIGSAQSTTSTTPGALAAAQATAERTEKTWFAQAQGLDAKLAPLLPCDATARKAIQDVSHASDARVTALMNYLHTVSAQAAEQTQAARRLLAAEESRAPEAADERTDASLERSAIEAQNANLAASFNARPGLGDAHNQLGEINDIAARRTTLAEQQAAGRDRGLAALRDLVAAYQNREVALKQETNAFQAESTRWSTYYSVRLSRAQAECTAVGGAPSAPAAKSAGKGKKKQ